MSAPIIYNAPKTVALFFASDLFVRLIIGPFGSGKSSGCTVEILRRAMQQERGPDGIRHTRFAVIRNSYRELADTTIKTVEEWIPNGIITWRASENLMFVKFNDVECEILFRALDTPDDVKKLLSLELTGAWINEAREVPKAVFEMLQGRIGRYPSGRTGGCTWSGLWMDTNPPDEDHWIYKLFEEDRPEGHVVFHQPSGLAPDAENIPNLLKGARHPDGRPLYYARMMTGKDPAWVDVYVHGRYGFVRDGKPVYPEYKDELHTLKLIPAPPPPGISLVLGMDFGLTPAIVVLQPFADGSRIAIAEFISDDMGATDFSRHVAAELRRNYPSNTFRGGGDPAGTQRSQVDERTPYEVVQAAGLPIDPVHTNDFVLRREAVAHALTRLTTAGVPALRVSPACKKLRKAMAGGYAFKRVQVTGQERFRDVPDKNMHSHVAEALQYAMLADGYDQRALDGGVTERAPARYKVKTALKRGRR